MTRQDRINEAAELIGAEWVECMNRYEYDASETCERWAVTEDELVELSDLMHHDDPDIRNDAYSHWCAMPGCGTRLS